MVQVISCIASNLLQRYYYNCHVSFVILLPFLSCACVITLVYYKQYYQIYNIIIVNTYF
jgi:hypothetical protein